MIISAAFLIASCGTEAKSDCEKDCKKESPTGKKEDMPQLEIGTANPSIQVSVKNLDGSKAALGTYVKENGLLVIFSCNTCPFVVGKGETSQGWENRYNDIKEWADKYKVGLVLVNSNEAKRDKDDSFEEMVKHAADKKYNNINYVVDENHVIADAYGARTTPHVYLFNNSDNLVYRGAIDDNVDSKEEVKEQYLANALKNLAEGTEINPAVTKNLGCGIKRVMKDEPAH